MPKVSIIVPVYNSEKHIKECLESLVNQTLKDIEIICINNNSTDNSALILEHYAQQDDRVKIYNEVQQGVSYARNLGLQKVEGEFILFVDADDWIELNSCEILYNKAKQENLEILAFSYNNYNNNNSNQDLRLVDFCEKKQEKTHFKNSFKDIFLLPSMVWDKIYNTNFIKKHALFFDTNISYGEDRLFFYNTIFKAKTFKAINLPLYNYRLDSNLSLTKTEKTFYQSFIVNQKIKHLIFSLDNSFDKTEIYKSFLENAVNNQLFYWNDFKNRHSKRENLKYLKLLKKEFNKFSKNEKNLSTGFNRLNKEIINFQTLFFKKLFEPLFELEFRRNRIVLYLFERQVLNFSTRNLNMLFYKFKYALLLTRLRFIAKKRSIRVGFWMTEHQKWSSFESIYNSMKDSAHFEPFVMLSHFKNTKNTELENNLFKENIEFLKENNIKYELAYNLSQNKFLSLKDFKPDIIFYQQPWQIHEIQSIQKTSNFALTCYVPYCYYSLDSYINYLFGFHGCVWKYFVESNMHKKEYEEKYNAKNCLALGSTKLDKYKNLKPTKIWKTNKKRIIYAPHHTFNYEYNYQTATFKENGLFILEYAKKHPEFEWIFRPHPSFKEKVIQNNILTKEELENYYKEWEKTGLIYNGADYYELFAESNCLITDCISFLAEYLPTNNPVIHLRKNSQNVNFNNLLKIITESYYQIYDNNALIETLETVLIQENDYLKEKRALAINNLIIENNSAGEKITKYLTEQLKLGEKR